MYFQLQPHVIRLYLLVMVMVHVSPAFGCRSPAGNGGPLVCTALAVDLGLFVFRRLPWPPPRCGNSAICLAVVGGLSVRRSAGDTVALERTGGQGRWRPAAAHWRSGDSAHSAANPGEDPSQLALEPRLARRPNELGLGPLDGLGQRRNPSAPLAVVAHTEKVSLLHQLITSLSPLLVTR